MGGMAMLGLVLCVVAIVGFALYGMFLGLVRLGRYLNRLWLATTS